MHFKDNVDDRTSLDIQKKKKTHIANRNPAKQGPSCETGSHSPDQAIPRLLWNRVNRITPLDPILSQMNSVHTLSYPNLLWSILILSSYLRLVLPSEVFLSDVPTKILHVFLTFHAWNMSRPSHLPWFEAPHYEILSFLIWLQLSWNQVFSSACFQTLFISVLPLRWVTKFHTHTKRVTLQFWRDA
jgi:hypothetical protein